MHVDILLIYIHIPVKNKVKGTEDQDPIAGSKRNSKPYIPQTLDSIHPSTLNSIYPETPKP